MPLNRLFAAACLFLTLGLGVGCMEQYHQQHNETYDGERATAHRAPAKLTETGDLPTPGGPAVSIDQRYTDFCASCHGAQGGGDGPAGLALNPKPRNLQDAAWQDATAEDRIYKVIKEGGTSVGLSAMMAPWGAVLNDDEIKAMVTKVRSFRK